MSADYSLSESGERVIAESRRPDGTVRKERRVRAGYMPQEEQQVYISRGAAFRQSVPKCPGFEETSTVPPKPRTKSASKNAKRKEKRLAELIAAPSSGSAAGAAAAAAVQSLSLGGSGGGTPAPVAAPAEEPSIEKQIRNLKKKMRQAEALAEKQGQGQPLTPEEEAKLSKLAEWQEDLRQLEAQL